MKLLIVDDNKSITDMLSNFLKLKGFEISVSNSGRSGLDLINRNSYDCVLLDLSMPDFSGLEVIDSLEKDGTLQQQRIIVFTASSVSNEDIDALLKRGIDSCLKKPVQLSELLQIIKSD